MSRRERLPKPPTKKTDLQQVRIDFRMLKVSYLNMVNRVYSGEVRQQRLDRLDKLDRSIRALEKR